MKCLTLSAFILFGCVQLFGQESRKEITVGFRVSHSVLDASFGDNAQRLAEITSFLNEVKGTPRSTSSKWRFAVRLRPRAPSLSTVGLLRSVVPLSRTTCAVGSSCPTASFGGLTT